MLNPARLNRITDRDLNLLVRAEEVFRRRWADDLGLNPHHVDLYGLPPVPRGSDIDFDALVGEVA